MSCCNDELKMLVGEKRYLEFKINPCGQVTQYFVILAASYQYSLRYSEAEPVSGDCIVDNDEKTIKLLFAPTVAGTYDITFTWSIADEIFKEKVQVVVC